jgi:hypothetical protein
MARNDSAEASYNPDTRVLPGHGSLEDYPKGIKRESNRWDPHAFDANRSNLQFDDENPGMN